MQWILSPLLENQHTHALAVYQACEDFLALGPEPHASAAMVTADLQYSREHGGLYSGIWHLETLVGVLDYIPSHYEGQPYCAFINLLMIIPSWRGSGLGHSVITRLEQQLSTQGITQVWTAVQVNNPLALSFWQHCGYVIKVPPARQSDGTTTQLLAKSLA